MSGRSGLLEYVRRLIALAEAVVADADDAVSWGPGLRCGVMDPACSRT